MAAEGLRRRAARRRRSDRWPVDRRGRLRLLEVRPGRARHQRHRLPPARAALGRGDRLPRRPSVAGGTDVTYGDVESAPAVVLRRAGARGGVPDPLPAAAQGATARAGLTVHAVAPLVSAGLDEAGAPVVDSVRAGTSSPRCCAESPRRPAHSADRAPSDPVRRRAPRHRPRWTVRRGRVGPRDRRQAGLGAAPARGDRGRGGDRLPAQPAARWPSGHRRRPPGLNSVPPGACRPARSPDRSAADSNAIIERGRGRAARRPGGRRRRPGRPDRPGARPTRRWTPADFLVSRSSCGSPPWPAGRRRRLPGRAGGGEGRPLPRLGRAAAAVQHGAGHHRR